MKDELAKAIAKMRADGRDVPKTVEELFGIVADGVDGPSKPDPAPSKPVVVPPVIPPTDPKSST